MSLLNSKPWDFKNWYIASLDSGALAVNTKRSSLPLASFIFCATVNNGPRPPSVTLLKSLKSITYPSSTSCLPLSANCSAFNLIVSFSLVATTIFLLVASVSSKSNTLIFFTGAFCTIELLRALLMLTEASTMYLLFSLSGIMSEANKLFLVTLVVAGSLSIS